MVTNPDCISFVIAKELLNKRKAEVLQSVDKLIANVTHKEWEAALTELKAIEDELWLLNNW
jgi:hypothetical protein